MRLDIWEALVDHKRLDRLGLGICGERVDIRGLELPDAADLKRFQFRGVPVSEKRTGVIIDGAKWRNLDFSNSKLAGLRIHRSHVDNCLFERCDLQGTRIWATAFRDVSFKGATLRGAVLGGVQDGVRNTYFNVDFSEADLSGTIYQAAAFEGCTFRNAKLVKVDFQTSTFTDCVFEGELDNVLFYARGFNGETYPPNEMVNVDFTNARLKQVGFRGLLLDRVRLPDDDEHIVINNFPVMLDRIASTLRRDADELSKKVVAFVELKRKWAVDKQAQGYINLKDLKRLVGEEGVERFLAAVPPGATNRVNPRVSRPE